MIQDRDQVHAEYGKLFQPDQLPQLSAEDFKAFLSFDNNRHWTSISRQQAKQTADMDALRKSLGILVDESQPIDQRLDQLDPKEGAKLVPGLGLAVLTPILHVVYPDKYGVWNTTSESAMTRLDLWPKFARGSSIGQKYVKFNDAANDVASKLSTDLWTVDSLWLRVERDHEPSKDAPADPKTVGRGPTPWSMGTFKPPPVKGAALLFLCSRCHMNKPDNLRGKTDPDLCIDCLD
jgi:hypothetical protein